jgi:hypothetical protein
MDSGSVLNEVKKLRLISCVWKRFNIYFLNSQTGKVGVLSFNTHEGHFGYPLVVLNQNHGDVPRPDEYLENNGNSIHGYYFKHTAKINFRYVTIQA